MREELPVLPLRNTVVFPQTVVPIIVQRPRSVRLVDDAVVSDRLVALVALRNPEVEDPMPDDLYRVGTLGVIHRLARTPDGTTLHLIIQGMERIRLTEFIQTDPYLRARFTAAPEVLPEPGDERSAIELEALVRSTGELFQRLVGLAPYLSEEILSSVLSTEDPKQLAYIVAASTRMDLPTRQEILELDQVADKLRRLIQVLTREVDVLELGKKIQSDAQSGIQEVQRE
ncbi:MAG: LON peptidase substrate-binding domain-containing protein, partial [Chloroflexi bacterium]|nr:LON peptidase substrate-binding domain-containing protein [Chloroflexota bacterium]